MTELPNLKSLANIQVVIATYNGALYFNQQISSILNQLDKGEVIIHDDGSNDETPNLIKYWSVQDRRIRLIEGLPQGSASNNFSYLLKDSNAPYVLCSDQDDIWCEGRIELLLDNMSFYEKVYGDETPLLLHTDLILINAEGGIISNSMWSFQGFNPTWGDHFNLLLTQNVVTGCTIMVNRALLNIALPIPPNASMHDHWLALVACGHGKVIYIDEPTVFYRQHNNNEVGAQRPLNKAKKKLKSIFFSERNGRMTDKKSQAYSTAACYAERYPNRPESAQARAFAALEYYPLLLRPMYIIRHRFFMNGWLRSLNWAINPSKYMNALLHLVEKTKGKL